MLHPIHLPLLSLALLPSCNLFVSYTAEGQLRKSIAHVPGAGLRVDSKNGGIEVVGGGSGEMVEVIARIRTKASTQKEAEARLEQVKLVLERRADDELFVSAVFPDSWRNSEAASFKILTPGAKGVILTSSNGSLKASGLEGRIVMDTSNGGVVLSGQAGDAVIETSNGRVTVKDHAGSLKAESSNGRIHAELAPGQPGPILLHTSNGPIRAVVDAAFAGEVRMSTSNGKARVIDPADVARRVKQRRSSATVVFGDSRQRSELRSSNGSVSIEVR